MHYNTSVFHAKSAAVRQRPSRRLLLYIKGRKKKKTTQQPLLDDALVWIHWRIYDYWLSTGFPTCTCYIVLTLWFFSELRIEATLISRFLRVEARLLYSPFNFLRIHDFCIHDILYITCIYALRWIFFLFSIMARYDFYCNIIIQTERDLFYILLLYYPWEWDNNYVDTAFVTYITLRNMCKQYTTMREPLAQFSKDVQHETQKL